MAKSIEKWLKSACSKIFSLPISRKVLLPIVICIIMAKCLGASNEYIVDYLKVTSWVVIGIMGAQNCCAILKGKGGKK